MAEAAATTTLSLLQDCNTIESLHQIHAHMIKTQQHHSPPLSTKLIAASARLDATDHAISVLSRSPPLHDPFAHNAIINAYIRCSSPLLSLLFYSLHPGPIPNTHTFPPLLKACAQTQSLLLGLALHALLLKLSLGSHLHSHTALLSLYSSCGDADSVRQLFDRSPYLDNIVCWNSIISGFVKNGNFKVALEFFRLLMGRNGGARPNEVTFVSALTACADLDELDLVRWIEDEAKKSGARISVYVGTALVDAYGKCGCVDDARRVFDEMPERDVTTWTAMIRGLAMFGFGKEAISLFEMMIQEGVCPDDVTFVGVLSACSHSGLVEEGRRVFDSMMDHFKLDPKMEHYGCMVDLFSRAGLLEDAFGLIKRMPLKPGAALWGSLLSACRRNPRNVSIAEYVAGHLMEIEPHNDATYVLLSNIYAYNNRWDDVARIRALMKERGIRKTPGCSSVEVDGVVHEFIVGDRSHPRIEDIDEMVEEIDVKVGQLGHVVDTSEVLLDIEEDEKKHALLLHSEKLALAFGLIGKKVSTPIRIVKNIRVCHDCHSVMKLASKAYDREIVVRDRNRFHRFRDGRCTCGDFW